MNLANATIVGYFSLPSPSLAEHNPSAYATALQDAPRGAGTCHHCGTCIRHHVVVRLPDGTQHFIGTDCASRVGFDPDAVRLRLTSDQVRERRERDAERLERRQAELIQEEQDRQAYLAERLERFGHIVAILRDRGTDFHNSLADQLLKGSLSSRQAEYVCKATSQTGRRNKKNAQAWDELYELCTG